MNSDFVTPIVQVHQPEGLVLQKNGWTSPVSLVLWLLLNVLIYTIRYFYFISLFLLLVLFFYLFLIFYVDILFFCSYIRVLFRLI